MIRTKYALPERRTKYEIQLGLIREIAWSFHRTTGIEYQELFAEASLAYCEALSKYCKGSGTLNVWGWRWMTTYLMNYANRYFAYKKTHVLGKISDEKVYQVPIKEFKEVIKAWPEDVQFLIQLVLMSTDLYEWLPPKEVRGKVVQQLREEGWVWARIWRTLRETKVCVNEMSLDCTL